MKIINYNFAGIKIFELKIHQGLNNLNIKNPVATIGIFDGVHKAHQEILDRLINKASEIGGESVLITLWPHPRHVLDTNKSEVKLLQTLDEKIERLNNTRIDYLIILPFTMQLAKTPFNIFIEEVLVKKLKIKHLVVGYNHHFGKDREGNYEKLKTYADIYGFTLERLQQYLIDDQKVSSSQIRKLIETGQIKRANKMLGYIFHIKGEVVKGEQIGGKLGFPTANIICTEKDKILPANGVYAAEIKIDNANYQGMLNIGNRPTLNNDGEIAMEIHIFNFDSFIYHKEVTLYFHARIRDEKRFSGVDRLVEQLSIDKRNIKDYFEKTYKS